jgi:hypothetical protein
MQPHTKPARRRPSSRADGDRGFAPLAVRPAEAERILRIGHTKLYQLLDNGSLESIKRGERTRLILMSSIRRFLGIEEDAA